MPTDFKSLVNDFFIQILALTIPVIFGLTLIVIIWGITSAWIINAGDESKVKEGKQLALAGVIALIFMSGIWGIVRILQASIFGAV